MPGMTEDESGDFLKSGQTVEDYVRAAFETENPVAIIKALGSVARTGSMSQLARNVGMSRSALYRTLSGDRNPEFATILKVMKALGLKLQSAPGGGTTGDRDAA